MSKIETYICDVCKKSIPIPAKADMQIIFVTEQTEGYPSKPYFQLKTLDICDACKNKALEGHYLFGAGAQGYNDYYFAKGIL